MPREIPQSLEGSQPTPNSEFNAADAMRVHEGIGLPGEERVGRMDETSSPESRKSFAEEMQEAQQRADKVCDELMPEFKAPSIENMTGQGTDFAKLQAGYEAYQQADLQPELVIAPIDLPAQKWSQVYSDLRKWQDRNRPGSSHRLLSISSGDGLYLTSPISLAWFGLYNQVRGDTPGHNYISPAGFTWKVLVVPTASRDSGGLAVNTSASLDQVGGDFVAQKQTLIGSQTLEATAAHMPLGTYLMLQAGRLLEDRSPIDTDTLTWNAGTFIHAGLKRAPMARWVPESGQVYITYNPVNHTSNRSGVRLPVWG